MSRLPVLALAAALALTGCSASVTSKPTAPTTSSAASASAEPTDTTTGQSPDGTNPDTAATDPDAGDEGVSDGGDGIKQIGIAPSNGRAAMGSQVRYANGVVVAVGKPSLKKIGPGAVVDPGGPGTAVVFDVKVTNGSRTRLEGDGVFVNLLVGTEGRVADTATDPEADWNNGMAGTIIAPGQTVTETYAFVASAADAKDVEAQTSPDGAIAYPIALFAGGVQ